MDFALSDEQRLLESTFDGYLDENVPVPRVRELMKADASEIAALWSELAKLGAAGVLIPEEHGGSGLSFLDAALIAQVMGRRVTPGPFLGSAVMAPVALLEAGTPETQKEWLPRIATGDVRVGVATTEVFSRREGALVRLEGGRLRGKALMAIDLPGADLILASTASSDLALVRPDAGGVSVESLSTIDGTRRLAEVVFDGVSPEALLGEPGQAGPAIERMLDAGRAVLAGDMIGACEAMLSQAVEYSLQRTQFGRVIGSFQAVKHMCAEMAAELEPARSLFWYAAHALGEMPDDAPFAIAHGKAHLSEVASFIATTSTKVHGGIGFTDEQNLHLWFKRIGLDRQLLGGPEVLRERAAELQGWAA